MTDAKDVDGENARLLHLIGETAQHWYALTNDIRIPWEGGIDGAMKAECDEIRKLTRERDDKYILGFEAGYADAREDAVAALKAAHTADAEVQP